MLSRRAFLAGGSALVASAAIPGAAAPEFHLIDFGTNDRLPSRVILSILGDAYTWGQGTGLKDLLTGGDHGRPY